MQLTQSIEQSHSQFSLLVNRIEIIYQSGPREENEIFILFPSLQDGYQWWSNWIIVVSCGQLQKWVDKKKKNIIVKQVTYIVADMARPRILAFQTSDEAWFLYLKSNSCSFCFHFFFDLSMNSINLFIYQFFVPIVIYFYSHPARLIPSNIFLSRNDIVLSF